MIEPVLVRRLSAITSLLALTVSAVALALGNARVAGGVAAGSLLGLLPIVTWAWLGGLLFSAKSPGLFGVISLTKLLLYAAALAILIGRNLVDPLAFAGALLAPGFLMAAMIARRGAGAAR
jgi:hypothetical protein